MGLVVARPWQGYGSVLFLELGDLSTVHYGAKTLSRGQVGLCIEWDWRVEDSKAVLFGSSNSRPEIERGIASLKDTTVVSIGIVGKIPELTVEFSNGHILRSMVMTTGSPQWHIRIGAGEYIWPKGISVFSGDSEEEVSEREILALDIANTTVERWNITERTSPKGSCKNCRSFTYLDGSGALLDYGVCTSEHSDFDRNIVSLNSGCEAFLGRS